MKNIIYAKFSNDRFENFQIKTFIIENEKKERFVEKHAATPEAHNHIAHIINKGALLEQYFKDSIFKINKIKNCSEYLTFEYIEGSTLEQILNNELAKGNCDLFYSIIDKYCSNIRKLATQEFIITPEFIEVFGERNFAKSLKSCVVTDIDLIFSNIVINNGWNVLDYEWSFDFPIPVDYIIYRALSNTKELYSLNLFNKYEISDELLIEFKQMEECFRNYVGYRTTINNYKKVCKATPFKTLLKLPTQSEYDEIKFRKNEMELHGEKLEDALNEAKHDIQMLQKRHCLDLQELKKYHQKDIEELKYYHQLDMQALTQLLSNREAELQIEIARNTELKNDINMIKKEKDELILQCEKISNSYTEIVNSLSWKIMKPVRSCLDLFKRTFR